jgi:hypothetical protein
MKPITAEFRISVTTTPIRDIFMTEAIAALAVGPINKREASTVRFARTATAATMR